MVKMSKLVNYHIVAQLLGDFHQANVNSLCPAHSRIVTRCSNGTSLFGTKVPIHHANDHCRNDNLHYNTDADCQHGNTEIVLAYANGLVSAAQ